mmetsp:Transcript_20124/g.37829  ORF Transcript_20124/g.37829 Transcript_20124/m.37829 type:complete len:110 (-) Transcript_20124:351-680(-)
MEVCGRSSSELSAKRLRKEPHITSSSRSLFDQPLMATELEESKNERLLRNPNLCDRGTEKNYGINGVRKGSRIGKRRSSWVLPQLEMVCSLEPPTLERKRTDPYLCGKS